MGDLRQTVWLYVINLVAALLLGAICHLIPWGLVFVWATHIAAFAVTGPHMYWVGLKVRAVEGGTPAGPAVKQSIKPIYCQRLLPTVQQSRESAAGCDLPGCHSFVLRPHAEPHLTAEWQLEALWDQAAIDEAAFRMADKNRKQQILKDHKVRTSRQSESCHSLLHVTRSSLQSLGCIPFPHRQSFCERPSRRSESV